MKKSNSKVPERTIGLDLGDKWTHWCEIDREAEVVDRGKVKTESGTLRKMFQRSQALVILENGTHSRWVFGVLTELGHEVIVANPRKVRLIYGNTQKHDQLDAENLARLGRLDRKLLAPIQYRGEKMQQVRSVLKVREGLVKSRTQLVNQVRGLAKANGQRLAPCSTPAFDRKAGEFLKGWVLDVVQPLLETIKYLTQQIATFDRIIESYCETRCSETKLLRQIEGVGPITALAFVATIEDPKRFKSSRDVGPYLGLTPQLDQSGELNIQLGITKAGDQLVRKLLVGSSQYILGRFGPDCDLQRHGLKIAQSGGKNAKKRAVVAVARKLAVLLHHLWVSGEVYEPLYNANKNANKKEQCAELSCVGSEKSVLVAR